MFSQPPFLASYTAPGWPQQFEPIRGTYDEFFPFAQASGDPAAPLRIRHWPDFSTRADAERMRKYVEKLAPGSVLADALHDAILPEGVARYPVQLQPSPADEPGEVSVYAIVGEFQNRRFFISCGWLADMQAGLRSGLQGQYVQQLGMNWDNFGNIVYGQNGWPWDTLYAVLSPYVEGAQLYWGNSSTGPVL